MTEVYRGHMIVVSNGNPMSAVIFERGTGTELPTKITSLPEENKGACIRRAQRLIDLYLDAARSKEMARRDVAPRPAEPI